MVHIKFVCLGNICRSPAAHAVFRHLVRDANLESEIVITSAGTGSWHIGNPPDKRMLAALSKKNIEAGDLRAELVTEEDIAESDLVLAMDESNFNDLHDIAREHDRQKIHLFMDFASTYDDLNEVPDPFYASDEMFNKVIEMVEDASEGLLAYLLSRFNLDG